MAAHTMNINPRSFEAIQDGSKTLEVRLKKDGVEQYAVGDTLTIRDRESGHSVDKKITSLKSYGSVEDLIRSEDLAANAVVTEPAAFVERLRSFQTAEDEQEYGLVAIRFGS